MRKLLLPVDSSRASKRALEYVLEAGAARGAEIHLVNVQPPVKARELWHFLEDDPIVDSREAAGREILRSAGELLEPGGYDIVSGVLMGDPVDSILRYAAENKCDAIVVGRRRHSRVGALVLGSVSFGIASRSPLPVTLVGPDGQAA